MHILFESVFSAQYNKINVTVQKEILELLERLREERKMSYLFICHDIALVQNNCDRVHVMHQGNIIEEGSSE